MQRLFFYVAIMLLPLFGLCTKWQLPNSATGVNYCIASSYNYMPGDTFLFPSAKTAGYCFKNFKGRENNPLVFMNSAGRTVIEDTLHSGIRFENCKHIHLTGTGSSCNEYGIHISNTHIDSSGVVLAYLCSDVEVDHIEIANPGGNGIEAKTDPVCDKPETWRSNGYVFYNLSIHHNYIHHSSKNGILVGYPKEYLIPNNNTMNCNNEYVFGHWFENILIYNNNIVHSGWKGIKVGLVRKKCKIYKNSIKDYGIVGRNWFRIGIEACNGNVQVFDNSIVNSEEYILTETLGIQMLNATSGSIIAGNTIVNTGGHGIYIHNRNVFESKDGYYILNNVIVNSGMKVPERGAGMKYMTEIEEAISGDILEQEQPDVRTYFCNNIIINPGAYFENNDTWQGFNESFIELTSLVQRDASMKYMHNNVFTRNADTLNLTANYKLPSDESILYGAGYDISSFPVSDIDFYKKQKTLNGKYHIGISEYIPIAAMDIEVNDLERNISYPNPSRGLVYITGIDEDINIVQVYNAEGDNVTPNVFADVIRNRIAIDLTKLKNGLYYVHVGNNNYPVFLQK